MNRFQSGVARAMAEAFVLPEPILELGAYQVAGQEEYTNLRPYFAGKRYIGVDQRPGPGVDQVADVEALPHADGSIGTVIAMNLFEHVPHFWKGFAEAHRVLRPDGAFLVCCPFYFHIHNYPSDYWRFTPEAYHVLLEKFPQRLVGWHGAAKRPAAVWALAYREEAPELEPQRLALYRDRMHQYAHEPLRWKKKIRYHLGRLLCGMGPFAPYLHQDRWDLEYRNELDGEHAYPRAQWQDGFEDRAPAVDTTRGNVGV
jgi:SAM-dependent methyltransferase